MKWMPATMQFGNQWSDKFGLLPCHNVPRAYESILFARMRGYSVCYRTDTGKAHIAKPMGQTYGLTRQGYGSPDERR